ncbi:sulfite exporter TauE/SafE family protein [Vibrio sp. NTOU-M3]|uniref:sulfite exporter TauE/SafE family protein n=1 Tax=Vibrio sp. NTOU-M3 TaxID=3234954 RepID=UPI00349FB4E4
MEWILLFFAGIFGGVINSVAGGGSFITFPTLMMVGVPPIMANATNTLAVSAGYISGAYGFRKEIAEGGDTVRITLFSLIGGALGAYLLLSTPESVFLEAIPWLLLFATMLFVFGGWVSQHVKRLVGGNNTSDSKTWLLAATLIFVSAYGGFFNAGLGIVVLSYLVLAGYHNINLMNGLKLLVSAAVSVIAIIIFLVKDMIDWERGVVVMLGTLIGGYLAARVSRKIPQHYVRGFVTCSSFVITAYYFIEVYF